jgi:hypothetical protein
MTRRLRRSITLILTLCACGTLTGVMAGADRPATPAWQGRVEVDVRWPADPSTAAVRVRELSALAWDPVRQLLVAGSDRGALVLITPPESGAEPARVSVWRHLRAEPGQPGAANIETLAWRAPQAGAPGTLWMAAEHDTGARPLDLQGRPGAARPWPPSLAQALQGSRHGVEAMTWDLRYGLVAALQRPRAASPGAPGVHVLHAEDGRQWQVEPSDRSSSLKAIEAMGQGAWLLLERLGSPSDGYRTVIRQLDPERCGSPATPGTGAVRCEAPVVPLHPPLDTGPDNFEGLACAEDGRCWIVSDGGTSRTAPTRLVQWRLEPRP